MIDQTLDFVDFSGGGSGGNNQALEQKLFKLQEEVTELHRRRGEVILLIISV
jgi:autophagy-related protein 16